MRHIYMMLLPMPTTPHRLPQPCLTIRRDLPTPFYITPTTHNIHLAFLPVLRAMPRGLPRVSIRRLNPTGGVRALLADDIDHPLFFVRRARDGFLAFVAVVGEFFAGLNVAAAGHRHH